MGTRQQEITEMLKQKKKKKKKKIGLRSARSETEHKAPTDLPKSLQAGAVIGSEPRPAGEQPKREAKFELPLCLQSVVSHLCCTQSLYIEEGFYEIVC